MSSASAQPSIGKTNAARRLYGVLLKLATENATSGFVTWHGIAQAVGLSRDDPQTILLVSRAIGRMVEDLNDVAAKARLQIESADADSELERSRDLAHLSSEIEPLRHVLFTFALNLTGKWSEARQALPESMLRPLRYLRKLLPEDEVRLESADLEALRAAVGDARRAILADPVASFAFKNTILELLRLLDDAIAAYAYGGISAVQASLRAFAVAAYAARHEVEATENRGTVQKLSEVWHKVSEAMDVVVQADAAIRIYEVLEKGWQLLLTSPSP